MDVSAYQALVSGVARTSGQVRAISNSVDTSIGKMSAEIQALVSRIEELESAFAESKLGAIISDDNIQVGDSIEAALTDKVRRGRPSKQPQGE